MGVMVKNRVARFFYGPRCTTTTTTTTTVTSGSTNITTIFINKTYLVAGSEAQLVADLAAAFTNAADDDDDDDADCVCVDEVSPFTSAFSLVDNCLDTSYILYV